MAGIPRMKRRSVVIFALTMALLAMGITFVFASHQFPDVPNGAFYHSSVDWLVDHGITAGCGGGKYCPNDPVTRGQMAVFLEKTHNIAPILGTDTGTGAQSITSTTYTALTGASVTVTVPSPNTARLLLTFSAESYCNDPDWCIVRILVDGAEAAPASGTDFSFDGGEGTADGLGASVDAWESHSMARTVVVGAGNHTVTVEGRVFTGGAGKELRLDDWLLAAQAYIQ